MRTFMVVKEEYTRYGESGGITLERVQAESLDDLAEQLEPDFGREEPEGPGPSPIEALLQANGDGMAYYLIRELLPDGTLGKDLMEGE